MIFRYLCRNNDDLNIINNYFKCTICVYSSNNTFIIIETDENMNIIQNSCCSQDCIFCRMTKCIWAFKKVSLSDIKVLLRVEKLERIIQ